MFEKIKNGFTRRFSTGSSARCAAGLLTTLGLTVCCISAFAAPSGATGQSKTASGFVDIGKQPRPVVARAPITPAVKWAGPDQCMNGSLSDAISSLRGAKAILARSSSNPGLPLDDFNFLRFHAMSGCHIQGMVELNIGNAFTYNRAANGNSIFSHLNEPCDQFKRGKLSSARISRKRGARFDFSSNIPHSAEVFHPSGMAAVGDYVFVAVDDGSSSGTPEVFVQDYSQNPPRLVSSFKLPGAGMIDSVAAGFDTFSGRFHLLMNQNSKNQLLVAKSNPTSVERFGIPENFTTPEVMSPSNGRYPGKRGSKLNYQSMALLRECDGKMLLVGLTNNNYPDCGGNFDRCDENIIDYAEYTPNTLKVAAWQTTGELKNPCNGFLDLDICPNFAAAGTIFVRKVDGVTKVIARAAEHWTEGGDIDVLSWVSR